MADAAIKVQPSASGVDVDNELIGSVYRQRTRVGGAGLADLAGCDTDYGLDVDVTRINYAAGTLNNGAETSVTTSATEIAAAAATRRKLIVQNNGAAAVRIGTTGVTATTGLRLAAGGVLVFDSPHCPTNAIFAISESGTNAVLAQVIS